MISFLKKIILKKNNIFYKLFLSPISNIQNIKNYNSFSSLYLRDSEASFGDFKYAIYFDNIDPAAIIQIDKWFSQNFFLKKETLIIFRIYSSSIDEHISYLESKNYNFYAFKVIRCLDVSSSKIKFIFYPFNSFTNPVLIKNRSIKHIWIAHGESDKLASVNPMIRMYDFIFTSGEIAINRLLNYKIINRCDIESKILKVGMPYLAEASLKKQDSFSKKILYAPTWEGVEIEQQYSSLGNNFGKNVLKKFTKMYENIKLYYMPHPSSGINNSSYKEYAKEIILENQDNHDFFIVQNKYSYTYKYISNLINPKNYIESINFEDFDLVITDVSSILSNLIYYKTNYVVLVNDIVVENHLSEENLKQNMPLLSVSNFIFENQVDALETIIDLELESNKQDRYNKLVSFESDKIEEQNLNFYINIMDKR